MKYRVRPISKTDARIFVNEHHRHNEAPTPMSIAFAVGLEVEGELVAVATAGRPVARMLDDGLTLEVSRVCVRDSHRNANSALYGAIGRAAKALGYRKLVTYTLESESGESLKASGFGEPVPIGARSWEKSNDPEKRPRYDRTLWGERRQAQDERKYRWERVLSVEEPAA